MGISAARQVGASDGNVLLDLFVLQQRIGELMEVALAGTGVRPAEYAVYSQLGIAAMTPRELGARLGVTPSTLTGHLAALERRGHARRTPNPDDGRSARIELTEEGRTTLAAGRLGFRTVLRAFELELPTAAAAVRDLLRELDAAAERTVAAYS